MWYDRGEMFDDPYVTAYRNSENYTEYIEILEKKYFHYKLSQEERQTAFELYNELTEKYEGMWT